MGPAGTRIAKFFCSFHSGRCRTGFVPSIVTIPVEIDLPHKEFNRLRLVAFAPLSRR
ncbi:hypothetical protein Z947_3220 [Sulfitobacter geojensis]|nr:hypothetical protein Z947_3220 [Sulfitobacter geojensis]